MSSTVRQKEFGSDHGLIHEAVVTGRKVGADENFWKALTDEATFRRVVQLVQGNEVPSGCVTPEEAARIMGSNFHSVDAAAAIFDFRLNAKQKRVLLNVPFSSEVLEGRRHTHVLVPGLPLSIMDMHAKANQVFYSGSSPWYAGHHFAATKVELGWHLILKTEVPVSTSRTWIDQLAMLEADEFVPNACTAVFAAVLHYLDTSERMLSRVWVRLDDVTAYGLRVYLNFDSDGLYLYYWSDIAYSYIGVASARKSS